MSHPAFNTFRLHGDENVVGLICDYVGIAELQCLVLDSLSVQTIGRSTLKILRETGFALKSMVLRTQPDGNGVDCGSLAVQQAEAVISFLARGTDMLSITADAIRSRVKQVDCKDYRRMLQELTITTKLEYTDEDFYSALWRWQKRLKCTTTSEWERLRSGFRQAIDLTRDDDDCSTHISTEKIESVSTCTASTRATLPLNKSDSYHRSVLEHKPKPNPLYYRKPPPKLENHMSFEAQGYTIRSLSLITNSKS